MDRRAALLRTIAVFSAGSVGLVFYRREAERTLFFDLLRGDGSLDLAAAGRAWLDIAPEEGDPETLRARLGLDGRPGLFGRRWRHALSTRIEEDLAASHLVALHGWLVTRTEARAFALAALCRGEPAC